MGFTRPSSVSYLHHSFLQPSPDRSCSLAKVQIESTSKMEKIPEDDNTVVSDLRIVFTVQFTLDILSLRLSVWSPGGHCSDGVLICYLFLLLCDLPVSIRLLWMFAGPWEETEAKLSLVFDATTTTPGGAHFLNQTTSISCSNGSTCKFGPLKIPRRIERERRRKSWSQNGKNWAIFFTPLWFSRPIFVIINRHLARIQDY